MRIRIILTLLIVLLPIQSVEAADKDGLPAGARSSEEGVMVTGPDPYNFEKTRPVYGTISIGAINVGDRWSALQNIDQLRVEAAFSTGESDYRIVINEPMINHINGLEPTWFGVVYNQPMHGDTNTGTNELPKVEPEIALFGWAEVYQDGNLIETRAPAHVKVMKKPPLKGITLEVGVEGKTLANTADGYLHVHWPEIDHLVMPEQQKRMREYLGWSVLILLNLWFGWLATRESVGSTRNSSRSGTRKK